MIAPLYAADKLIAAGKDPDARQRRDTAESFEFRQRMETGEAQSLLTQRSSIAEYPHAECRHRGLHQFRVRGLAKVKAVAPWHALTFNFPGRLHLGIVG